VQVQQIRTISKQRITSDAVGSLNEEIMQFVNIALKLHLDVD